MTRPRRKRDKETTREAILKAAENIFARHGFAASSINKISHESGISDGLILYHFSSKENLYRAVRENMAAHYGRSLWRNRVKFERPRLIVENGIRTAFNFFKNHPTYTRLSLWSYLEGKADIIENEAKITTQMVEILTKMQKLGIVKKKIVPVVPMTMVIGAIHYWLRYRDKYMKILAPDCTVDEYDELFVKQLSEALIKTLTK